MNNFWKWVFIIAVGTAVACIIAFGLYCTYKVAVSELPWWMKVFLLGK